MPNWGKNCISIYNILYRLRQLGYPPPVTGFFYWTGSSHLLLAYKQWVDTIFLLMYRQLVTVNNVQIKYLQWRMRRDGRDKKDQKRGNRDKRGQGRRKWHRYRWSGHERGRREWSLSRLQIKGDNYLYFSHNSDHFNLWTPSDHCF